jgi:hypothetical protein
LVCIKKKTRPQMRRRGYIRRRLYSHRGRVTFRFRTANLAVM